MSHNDTVNLCALIQKDCLSIMFKCYNVDLKLIYYGQFFNLFTKLTLAINRRDDELYNIKKMFSLTF
jgi:hypothetical protein